MYSAHMAKLTAWHRYYTRFWKVTVQFCDWRWPDFVNVTVPNKVGCTGIAEPRFFQAVTGDNKSFLQGIELGRKIWNLDQVIWTLQGRHRDQVKFADYIYEQEASNPNECKWFFPSTEMGGGTTRTAWVGNWTARAWRTSRRSTTGWKGGTSQPDILNAKRLKNWD